jgi:uncharacterized coiled-coil DUF342 family protein
MSFFQNIFSLFSKNKAGSDYIEMTSTIEELRKELDTLSKTVEDQRAMIMYISTIQTELATECFSLGDTLKQIASPKKTSIRFPTLSNDDDDLIN